VLIDDLPRDIGRTVAILAEDRSPPGTLWDNRLVTSRLTEYEVWTRIHARHLGPSHGEALRPLLSRLSWLELTPMVLVRALEPWPLALRTLDALHFASVEFLRNRAQPVSMASYDERLIRGASSLDIPLFPL
jgi:hypothetical protein